MFSQSQPQPKKPKGILKKPAASPAPTQALAPVSPFPVAERNPTTNTPSASARDTAVQQALVIQQQYAFEDQIQDSIIALSYFPLERSPSTNQPYDAANPAPSDVAGFRQHVRAFQPGDYEDMIEERNTRNLCGYALCGRPRVRAGPGGEFKLVNYGRKDFNIIPKKELERWCSQRCARRAMYIKVQLNETAAWERAGIPSIQIELLDEPKGEGNNDAANRVAKELQNLKIDEGREATRIATDLALERGDTKDIHSTRSIDVDIQDKPVLEPVQEPKLAEDNDGHLILDGYKTKFGSKSKPEMTDNGGNVAEVAGDLQNLSMKDSTS